MSTNRLQDVITRMENYLECWKQFNHYLGLARFKKFTMDDEHQFMEIKSVITQELELILATIEGGQVTRDDVHSLMTSVPSMRFLSESNESSMRSIENQWHKLFISWQSILGQMKVRQKQNASKGFFASLVGK
jgi:threonyl-tRNA synthetase